MWHRKKPADDFTTWPETYEAALIIIKAYRAMNIEPNEFLLRLVGEPNDRANSEPRENSSTSSELRTQA